MNDNAPTGALRQLPNLITLARAVAGLVGAAFLIAASNAQSEAGAIAFATVSGVILLLAAISDFLDGWLARALGASTPLGALIDPIADKVLIGAYLIAFALIAELHLYLTPAVVIIIARDVVVTALRLSRLGRREVPLPVTDEAKFKTALSMILVTLPFLAGLALYPFALSTETWLNLFLVWVGGVWLAAALSAWTAWPYLRKALIQNF